MAVCVLRDPVARLAFGSISLGSGRRPADALRSGDECPSNGHQCRVDARDRNAVHGASGEPDVARCDIANAVAAIGGPSTARTV
jgi:GTP cyclohydrolase III